MPLDDRSQAAVTELENYSVLKPGDHNVPALETLLDQVVAWSEAAGPQAGGPLDRGAVASGTTAVAIPSPSWLTTTSTSLANPRTTTATMIAAVEKITRPVAERSRTMLPRGSPGPSGPPEWRPDRADVRHR